jgi:hypothetical protein
MCNFCEVTLRHKPYVNVDIVMKKKMCNASKTMCSFWWVITDYDYFFSSEGSNAICRMKSIQKAEMFTSCWAWQVWNLLYPYFRIRETSETKKISRFRIYMIGMVNAIEFFNPKYCQVRLTIYWVYRETSKSVNHTGDERSLGRKVWVSIVLCIKLTFDPLVVTRNESEIIHIICYEGQSPSKHMCR